MKQSKRLYFYIALLRGINVGGKNMIPMPKLKTCFEALHLKQVATYIQSGNVIFVSEIENKKGLIALIEKGLYDSFKISLRATLLSLKELEAVIKKAPQGFGASPNDYRYDVIFLFGASNSKTLLRQIKTKEGVDKVSAGRNVLYFSRLAKEASKSYLSKIIQLPEYKEMTVRNWNTTTKLYKLLSERRV